MQLYVEDQTDGMVQSIQSLVASIRAEQEMSTVETHVSDIANVVANVVSSAQHFINQRSGDATLRELSEPTVHALEDCRGRLLGTASEGHSASSPEQLREVTNQLPPIAFEIARQAKELVQRLESMPQNEDDNFL